MTHYSCFSWEWQVLSWFMWVRTFLLMHIRKAYVRNMNRVFNPTLLSPSWPCIPSPPAIRLRAVARLWTETPLRLTRWPGHPQPSPWVCECLVWYVRLSSGRHRMWSRCSSVEKSCTEGHRGQRVNRNKTPILCCEVWGHKFIFNKKVVLFLVIFPLLPLSVNQLFTSDLIWGRGADFEAPRGSLYWNVYIKAIKQRG